MAGTWPVELSSEVPVDAGLERFRVRVFGGLGYCIQRLLLDTGLGFRVWDIGVQGPPLDTGLGFRVLGFGYFW